MSFIKYPSFENHYNQKNIRTFRDLHNDVLNEIPFVVQEKIHGTNIQLIFSPHEKMKIASRNQLTDEGFFNIGEVLSKIANELDIFQNYCYAHGATLHLYGELFGDGIQKGVEYGREKRLLFFDMRINDKIQTQDFMRNFFIVGGLDHLLIPVLDIVTGLDTALGFDTNINTTLFYHDKTNICEGIVIKPLDRLIYNQYGELLYIKKKNESFKEKQRQKNPRVDVEYTPEVNRWNEVFLSYLNDERLQTVISKYGPLKTVKDIGKYIGYMLIDARETFLREEEFDQDNFGRKELKAIFNGNKTASKIVVKYGME